jgi:protein SCO1/2
LLEDVMRIPDPCRRHAWRLAIVSLLMAGAHHAVAGTALIRSAGLYRPAAAPVVLTRSDGKRVALEDELAYDGPVLLNFVFTTCSAVCPIASRTFAEVQARLGTGEHARLMSISLDPMNDTPAVLRAYAGKFGAGPDWHFYTGSVEASSLAQRAFDLYRGDKMNHAAVTMVRPAHSRAWVRLEGFPSSEQLVQELRGTRTAGLAGASPR